MFLRATKRFKDGKAHRYWSVVENRRVAAGHTVQKNLLYLGEINNTEHAAWTCAIEAIDQNNHTRHIHLFPEDRTPNPQLEHSSLRLCLAIIHLPPTAQKGKKNKQEKAAPLRFELDRDKLRDTRRHEGQYLLRSSLSDTDPAELLRNYMNLVRIEESFRNLKGDLGLRSIFHQLDRRIEAHVFINFLAYCLHVTLEQYNRKAATGLSSRSVLRQIE